MTGPYRLNSEIVNMPRLRLKPDEAVEITSELTTDGQTDLLRALASIDEDGNIYLIVLNRSCNTDFTVKIDVPGYAMSKANVEILWHEDITAVNTYEAPETVVIKAGILDINGESFEFTLPYCSMVALGWKRTLLCPLLVELLPGCRRRCQPCRNAYNPVSRYRDPP